MVFTGDLNSGPGIPKAKCAVYQPLTAEYNLQARTMQISVRGFNARRLGAESRNVEFAIEFPPLIYYCLMEFLQRLWIFSSQTFCNQLNTHLWNKRLTNCSLVVTQHFSWYLPSLPTISHIMRSPAKCALFSQQWEEVVLLCFTFNNNLLPMWHL